MLADVRARRESEKELFRGMCDKSGFCQSEKEEAAVRERDAAEKRIRPKVCRTQTRTQTRTRTQT